MPCAPATATSADERSSFPSSSSWFGARGYLQGIKDIGNIVLKSNAGVPLRLSDVARVELVPDERRGITELNGEAARSPAGSSFSATEPTRSPSSRNAKESLAAVQSTLPAGTEILPVYDRSKLIEAAIETLKATLIEESIVGRAGDSCLPPPCPQCACWRSSCCRSVS